jgi:hypothetical protein
MVSSEVYNRVLSANGLTCGAGPELGNPKNLRYNPATMRRLARMES